MLGRLLRCDGMKSRGGRTLNVTNMAVIEELFEEI